LNVLRKFMAAEAAKLKPLLDMAYGAILRYQGSRTDDNERKLRAALAPAIDHLTVFKPYMPAYKQAYFDALFESWRALSPRDLIMLFDHCIDIMHLRLSRDLPGDEAEQPWSKDLLAILDQRLQTPSLRPVEGDFACSGVPASPGRVAGRARVVIDDAELANVRPGEVVVCKMSRPDWVLVFSRAAALVADQGGAVCHAAIAAREYGLPCVTGCGNATTVIRTGDEVEVDGDLGLITRPSRTT
jgi:phosphohistidine swiveling domain-containing protein